jgi:hypothetical protein
MPPAKSAEVLEECYILLGSRFLLPIYTTNSTVFIYPQELLSGDNDSTGDIRVFYLKLT